MAYQSLYRRYRPQKFSEIRGQDHVVAALRNAVANDQVGHAYMFSGPRGTGKTSSARVLAKALNCENLDEGSEPCCTCDSCEAIEQGRSFDLHELDAASNNGVEDMRELLGKVNLGNPGRMKVYILDEVHMLTRGAENSLLKTLEEPPGHVVWVLATTEPHKVVETIRSRCQVFELGLLGAEEVATHVRWVTSDAGLDVDDDAVDYVVSVGGGSVRDTLSALDRVVAAGGVIEIDQSAEQLLQSLAANDTAAALGAVGAGLGRGRDPRTIGETLVAGLRDAFLTAMGSPPPRITAAQQERAAKIAEQMSPLRLTRALETLGTALVEMRQAPDPRVHLEVALVRLCRSFDDSSVDSLIERVEQLETRLAAGTPSVSAAPSSSSLPSASAKTVSESASTVGALPVPPVPPAPSPPPVPPVPPAPSSALVAQTHADQDLRSLQPKSAKEVVELAGLHLSLGRNLVVSKANSFLGPSEGPRSKDDLQRLWQALVDELGRDSALVAPTSADEAPATPHLDTLASPPPDEAQDPISTGPREPQIDTVEGVDELAIPEMGTTVEESTESVASDPPSDGFDLNELMDASSHTDQVVELLEEAFPGAEIETPSANRADR